MDVEYAYHSLPRQCHALFSSSPNPRHVADVTYSFSFDQPKGQTNPNISTAITALTANGTKPSDHYCVTILGATSTPANVTNLFTSNTSTDCAPVLGEECVAAIVNNTVLGLPGPTGCPSPHRVWSDLPACAATFGFIRNRDNDFGLATFAFDDHTSGDTLWMSTTVDADVGDDTMYVRSMNRLQVVLVALPAPPVGSAVAQPGLLCARVSTAAVESGVVNPKNANEASAPKRISRNQQNTNQTVVPGSR
ncbi:hypothetical protein B0T22DRAFT_505263 [Podospora appendiculata]|uniref:Uncharacterized protein n=1 Tax=Podospora appendiculata TaxID=314037 RepID=A0AAE0XI74_9PEZI|nr:hypothetical protein B0T22DRAFT_505263 [Podospora appendiculata]